MKQILVVEDDTTISLVLKAYLEKEGYSVRQAFTCEEAKEMFDLHSPDLILLDITLPDDSGWNTLHFVRERSACPVIMLTALGTIQDKLQGLNQGADDYITKPFIGEEIIARVNAVLRRSARVFEQEDAKFFGSLKVNFKSHSVQWRAAANCLRTLSEIYPHTPTAKLNRNRLLRRLKIKMPSQRTGMLPKKITTKMAQKL